MPKQFTHPTDGRVGGGEGARDVLQPSLSAGLMNAFCLLGSLSVYNSTTCQILVDTHVCARVHAHSRRGKEIETEMKWLLKAKEGSHEIGDA